MGERGPRGASDNVRELRGDRPSVRKAAAKRKPPASHIPACPGHLSAHAKAVWKALAPELHESGYLRATTREVFAAYCEAAANAREAQKELHGPGQDPEVLTHGDKGRVVKHPALQIFRDNVETMVRIARDWDQPGDAAASEDTQARYLS